MLSLLVVLVACVNVTSLEVTVQHFTYALDDAIDIFNGIVRLLQAPNNDTLRDEMMRIPHTRLAQVQTLMHRKGRDVLWPANDKIPKSFDAREKWKNCPVIKEVQDQSHCASDWAVSIAQMLTDRYCIATAGVHQARLSAQFIMACLHSRLRRGCLGGSAVRALQFVHEHGVPSGGAYGSQDGCMPYFLPPCNSNPSVFNVTKYRVCDTLPLMYPHCYPNCTNKRFKGNITNDFRKFSSVYILRNEEKIIKKDIMTYGPAVAVVTLYEDFLKYKGGIYDGVSGHKLSLPRQEYHLKIFGWGVEHETQYWLVMNSLNDFWGERGTAKIRMNSDILMLGSVHGAVPATEPYFWSSEYKKSVFTTRVKLPNCDCDDHYL